LPADTIPVAAMPRQFVDGDRPRISVRSVEDAPLKQPRRKRPMRRIDGRLRVARRVKELTQLFASRIGEAAADPLVVAAIKRASELRAIAESLRARLLRADPAVSPDDLVRCERLANQAERALRLDRHSQERSQVPDLKTYLAGIGQQQEPQHVDHD
jgi:hypothetical protein